MFQWFEPLKNLHDIFERYSWILWMWSKIFNCFNNQKDGQENTSNWAKKKLWKLALFLLTRKQQSGDQKNYLKGDKKTNLTHNNRIIGSAVIKRTRRNSA